MKHRNRGNHRPLGSKMDVSEDQGPRYASPQDTENGPTSRHLGRIADSVVFYICLSLHTGSDHRLVDGDEPLQLARFSAWIIINELKSSSKSERFPVSWLQYPPSRQVFGRLDTARTHL